jgi:hypothetical protein
MQGNVFAIMNASATGAVFAPMQLHRQTSGLC